MVSVVVAARSEPRHVQNTISSLRFGEDCGALRGSSSNSGSAGAPGVGSTPGFEFAEVVQSALEARVVELEGLIKRGERWEKGKPVGVEGLREEYEALLKTRSALLG